jgi:hypothetical protein
MQGTFIGFNTASIKYDDKFLALMLKVKQSNQLCQSYYLQAPILADLLLVLQHRMAIVLQRLNTEGEKYKNELLTCNEQLIKIRRLSIFRKYSTPIRKGVSCR